MERDVSSGHHPQPTFSEGRTPGSGQPIGTTAVPVEGGYKVTGKKNFASLSGIANIHNVVALVDGDPRVRLLGVPADAEGASIEGDWDPLGMRGTDSRDLILTDAFVPDDHEVLPRVFFDAMVQRFPYFYMTLSFSYLGLMRAILDLTGEYLRGEHGVASRRDNHVKQARLGRDANDLRQGPVVDVQGANRGCSRPQQSSATPCLEHNDRHHGRRTRDGVPGHSSVRRPINAPTEQTRTALPRCALRSDNAALECRSMPRPPRSIRPLSRQLTDRHFKGHHH